MRQKLNDYAIKALHASEGPPYDVWDAALPGFGLRVGKLRKTFIVNTGTTRKAIGVYPVTSLKDARDQAKRVLYAKYLPKPTLHAPVLTEEYLNAIAGQKKPSTVNAYGIYLKRIPNKSLSDLTPQLLYKALPDGKGAANLCFNVFKAFLSWCVEQGHIDTNPLLKRRQPNKLKSRDRLLTDDEIKLIWRESFNHNSFGRLIRVLLLSGQRLSQFARFDRSWLRDDVIVFPPSIMKGNEEHTLPVTTNLPAHIPPEAIRHVNMRMNTFRAALPTIPHFTLHDFRRFFSSTMAKLGTPIHVTEQLLAHKTGSRSQIQRVYDLHTYLPEMRQALEAYERYVFDVLQCSDHAEKS